jgi:RHS repeat-associated protein
MIATTWNSSGSERIGSVYRYDLHGNLAAGSESGDTGSEIGYTGGLRLSEGLVYLGARVYDPTLRQFLQPDNVDSHRYSYVHGDPSNRVDPTGHEDKVEPVASPNPFDTPEWQAFFAGAGQASGGTIRGIGGDPDAPVGGGMLDASGTPMVATIGGFLNGWYGALGNRLPAWLRSLGASMGGHWQDDPNGLGADDCGGEQCGPLEIVVHGGKMSWIPNDGTILAAILIPLSKLRVPAIKAFIDGNSSRFLSVLKGLENSEPLPPILVNTIANGEYYIMDGVRRSVAARELGMQAIEGEVIGQGFATASIPLSEVVVTTATRILSSALSANVPETPPLGSLVSRATKAG